MNYFIQTVKLVQALHTSTNTHKKGETGSNLARVSHERESFVLCSNVRSSCVHVVFVVSSSPKIKQRLCKCLKNRNKNLDSIYSANLC